MAASELLVTVSVGRSELSCAWSFGDMAVGAVSNLLNAALGATGAGLSSPHASVHTVHNPTTNKRLIFIS